MRPHEMRFVRQNLLNRSEVEFELGDPGPSKTMIAAALVLAGHLAPITEIEDAGVSPTRLRYRLTPDGRAAFDKASNSSHTTAASVGT
jgi:hypothetical protein